MRCQGAAAGREHRAGSCWKEKEKHSAHISWENREPGHSHEGEIASARAADAFPQLQPDPTAAQLEREWKEAERMNVLLS